MNLWTWKKENLPSVRHAVRTAIAATLSVLLARLVGLPEPEWAVIATLVVMQSPLSSTVPLAIQRIVASAVGASLGIVESTYFGANLVAFAFTIFVLGLVSLVFRLEKVGYSYAGMTLAIIVLISRHEAPWMVAVHRFAEVSLGILVALAVVVGGRSNDFAVGQSLNKKRFKRTMRALFKKSEISFLNPRLPANISSRLIFSGQSLWITLGKYHEIDSGNAAGRRC